MVRPSLSDQLGVLPARAIGVIARVDTRERGFIFITGEDGREYFAHTSGFDQPALFDGAKQGDGVSFRVARTGKGFRAFDVQAATEAELVRLEGMEESRGNA